MAGALQAYFQRVRRALNAEGGVFVMDLLGGHEAESTDVIPRHNGVTGASFLWEQEAFDPVTRHIRAYITLRDPATRKVGGSWTPGLHAYCLMAVYFILTPSIIKPRHLRKTPRCEVA